MSIKIRVPGKLLLAGEYSILVPGSLALGLAVDRYLSLEMHRSEHWLIQTDLLSEPWIARSHSELNLNQCPGILKFVVSALSLGINYLSELGHEVPCFNLSIQSDLNDNSLKLGLGSSGAVCVGVIAGLLAWLDEDLSSPKQKLRIYKLALLAHRTVQGNGSGADIATSIYGAVTAYTAPDFQVLARPTSLSNWVDKLDWPMLGIERLPANLDANLLIGWTGSPAYSRDWVQYFNDWRVHEPMATAQFLFDSNANVLALRESLIEGHLEHQIQAIARARRILSCLNEAFPASPETDALMRLADCAQALGGAGKLSGAGGGDCGLALVPEEHVQQLIQSWSQSGIKPLELNLDYQGFKRI